MDATLTLAVRRQPGILMQVAGALGREGLHVTRNQFEDREGLEIVNLTLDLSGSDFNPDRLADIFRSISGIVRVERIAIESAASATAVDPVRIAGALENAFTAIAKNPKSLAAELQQLHEVLPSEAMAGRLWELGEKLGIRAYRKDYALGSPLRLTNAIKRMVVPALKSYCVAKPEEMAVVIPECPVCLFRQTAEPCCHLFSGFIEGFLNAAPLTKGIRVVETACIAKGDVACRFEMMAEAAIR